MNQQEKHRFLILIIIFALTILTSIFIGRYDIKKTFDGFRNDLLYQKLITQIRIPRIVAATIAGFALSIAGQVMQTVFRNPLAEPGIMGVSQAAGFGAAIGILFFGQSTFFIQFFAFLFSMIALFAVLLFAYRSKRTKILSLVLSGIAISAFFSAGLGLLKYIADPVNQLPGIVFWLLGSLSSIDWDSIYLMLGLTTPIFIFFWFYRWRLNIHSLQKEVSFSLGMKNNLELYLVLISSVFLTSTVISQTGIIGWVGLLIPNYARLLIGQNTEKSLPFSAIAGGIFMLICDNLSRTLLPGEIPVGIFTAFFGALLFSGLIFRRKIIN